MAGTSVWTFSRKRLSSGEADRSTDNGGAISKTKQSTDRVKPDTPRTRFNHSVLCKERSDYVFLSVQRADRNHNEPMPKTNHLCLFSKGLTQIFPYFVINKLRDETLWFSRTHKQPTTNLILEICAINGFSYASRKDSSYASPGGTNFAIRPMLA